MKIRIDFNTSQEFFNNRLLLFFSFYVLSRYTAATVMEMDFERIDINQCPKGNGNIGANRFVGTAKCKEQNTEVIILLFFFIARKIINCIIF